MKSTIDPTDREELIRYRCEKADQTLEEAEYCAAGKYFNIAVNRLYYSAYYAVTALLIRHNLATNTHAGVRTLLGLHFIKTGKLDIQHGKTFMSLFESRQSGDYEDFVYCDLELYNMLKPRTIALIDAIKKLILEK